MRRGGKVEKAKKIEACRVWETNTVHRYRHLPQHARTAPCTWADAKGDDSMGSTCSCKRILIMSNGDTTARATVPDSAPAIALRITNGAAGAL